MNMLLLGSERSVTVYNRRQYNAVCVVYPVVYYTFIQINFFMNTIKEVEFKQNDT